MSDNNINHNQSTTSETTRKASSNRVRRLRRTTILPARPQPSNRAALSSSTSGPRPSPSTSSGNRKPKKGRRRHRRRNPASSTKRRLSDNEERGAHRISVMLYYALWVLLAPAVRRFLVPLGLVDDDSVVDGYEYLKTIKKGLKGNLAILQGLLGGGERIEIAQDGRNSVAHNDLGQIFHNWKQYTWKLGRKLPF